MTEQAQEHHDGVHLISKQSGVAAAGSGYQLPCKEMVAIRLLNLPTEIREAEDKLITKQSRLMDDKRYLADKEAELLTTEGAIEGKNAEQRNAKLHRLTETERIAVEETEKGILFDRRWLTFLNNEFSAYRSVAKLIGGVE